MPVLRRGLTPREGAGRGRPGRRPSPLIAGAWLLALGLASWAAALIAAAGFFLALFLLLFLALAALSFISPTRFLVSQDGKGRTIGLVVTAPVLFFLLALLVTLGHNVPFALSVGQASGTVQRVTKDHPSCPDTSRCYYTTVVAFSTADRQRVRATADVYVGPSAGDRVTVYYSRLNPRDIRFDFPWAESIFIPLPFVAVLLLILYVFWKDPIAWVLSGCPAVDVVQAR